VKAFDVEAVKNLGEIVYMTGAQIVVSSTWRLRANLYVLRELFRNLPFAHTLLDTTGEQRTTRAEEVLAWLLSHPGITSFVIIDDMLDGLDSTFPDHFVKCDAGRGFGNRAAFDLALSILHRTDGGTPHV
jgi:HAD domain in Swiss Army Knife RNA repair proteins